MGAAGAAGLHVHLVVMDWDPAPTHDCCGAATLSLDRVLDDAAFERSGAFDFDLQIERNGEFCGRIAGTAHNAHSLHGFPRWCLSLLIVFGGNKLV